MKCPSDYRRPPTAGTAPRLLSPRKRVPLPRAAFTLMEVMAAASVLALGISTSLVTLQSGISAVSNARHLTQASQIMQTELEAFRMKSWAQVQALEDAGDSTIITTAGALTVTCTRTITELRPGMKEIAVAATWGGDNRRAHSARMITRFSQSGLNDYFYTSR